MCEFALSTVLFGHLWTKETVPGELLKEAKSFLEDGLVAPQIIKASGWRTKEV